MAQEVSRKPDEELLKTYPIRGKTTGWFFRLEETSAGAWSIYGTDPWGRTISLSGTDQDDLLMRAEADAQRIKDDVNAT
ncbi:MAG: hypothetical protein OER97_05855 [Gammaproteobacteria bacterium]|nr:hypothetical protein [Gammaproteobacteria bacterium]